MAKGTFPVGALVGSLVTHALAVLLLSTISPPRVDAGAGPMVVEVSLVGDAGDDGEDGAVSPAPASSRGTSQASMSAPPSETGPVASTKSPVEPEAEPPPRTPVESPQHPPGRAETVRVAPPPVKPEPAQVAESTPHPPELESPKPVTPEPVVSDPVSHEPPRQVATMVTKPVGGKPVPDAASGHGPVGRHEADGGAGRQGDGGKKASGQGTSGQGTSGQGAGTRSAGYTLGSASCPAPDYPRMARLRGQEGRVVLRVSVAADGRVTATTVLTSSGYSLLDRAAARTVAGWRLDPARRVGVSVPTTETISIRFDLTPP